MIERCPPGNESITALDLGLECPYHFTYTTIMDTLPRMPYFMVFYKIRPMHNVF